MFWLQENQEHNQGENKYKESARNQPGKEVKNENNQRL
jgi:hypothetical protein